LNDDALRHHRDLRAQLRERFNAMRMTVGVLEMADTSEQAAEWLHFIADAAADCSNLVTIIADLEPGEDD
jgi:hypothetical protein